VIALGLTPASCIICHMSVAAPRLAKGWPDAVRCKEKRGGRGGVSRSVAVISRSDGSTISNASLTLTWRQQTPIMPV